MTLLDDLFRRPTQATSSLKLLERAVSRLAGARMRGDRAVVDVDGDEVPLDLRSDGNAIVMTSPTVDLAGGRLGCGSAVPLRSAEAPDSLRTARDVAAHLDLSQLDIYDGGDAALAAVWLDDVVREALPQLFWVSQSRALCARAIVAGGEVAGWPVSSAGDHLAAIADVVASLATRPKRLARKLAADAAPLGGRAVGDSWGLDGGFALLFPRGGREVVIDYVRALAGQRRVHLRTRARVACGLTPAALGERIRAHAPLARKVSASAYAVLGDDVVIAVDGMPEDLAPLVELAGRLAGEPASTGPYR